MKIVVFGNHRPDGQNLLIGKVAMELGFVRGFFYSRPHQLEISYYPEILIEMAHNVTELCTIFNLIAFIRSHSDFYFFGVLLIGS